MPPPGAVLPEWPNRKTKARVQATITAAPTAMITPQGVDRRAVYWPGACCQPGCRQPGCCQRAGLLPHRLLPHRLPRRGLLPSGVLLARVLLVRAVLFRGIVLGAHFRDLRFSVVLMDVSTVGPAEVEVPGETP